MKAFEKWNRPHKLNDLAICNEHDAKWNEKYRKEGWKAALREVLTNENWGYDEYDEYGKLNGDRVICKEDIEKELEGELKDEKV